jgi:hypothetical protein
MVKKNSREAKGSGVDTPAVAVAEPNTLGDVKGEARSHEIAKRGIRTRRDLTELTCAAIEDVVLGRMDVKQANAAFNGVGKALQSVSLQLRAEEMASNSEQSSKKDAGDGSLDLLTCAPSV